MARVPLAASFRKESFRSSSTSACQPRAERERPLSPSITRGLSMTIKILTVVGARPNFMKAAPIIRAINTHNQRHDQKIEHMLLHTGQHYDERMSDAFFADLKLPRPDVYLEVGSGS